MASNITPSHNPTFALSLGHQEQLKIYGAKVRVMSVLSIHKALGSVANTTETLGMVMHACNLSV